MVKEKRDLFLNTKEKLDTELLAEIMRNSHDGIFVVDNKGKFIMANPSSINMLEFAFEEIVGQYVSDLLKEGIYTGSPSTEAAKTGKLHTGLVKTRNGKELMSISRPIFDEKGNLKYIITNCRSFDLIKKFCEEHIGKANFLSDSFTDDKSEEPQFITNNESMRVIIEDMMYAARTDCPILLLGQTGTGKGMLAEYIHQISERKKGEFVEINCAAIPDNLLEAELFGYEKGAFTGANEKGKLGLFEIANNGTIFLDEIGELPLQLQTKLLKVLDSGYVRRLGGTIDHKINVRIISATNRDLLKMIANDTFREDLYYRLNVVSVKIPSLKERKNDIPNIVEYYIKKFNKKYSVNKSISKNAVLLLSEYDWPGNIRQLKNIIERLVILSKDNSVIQEKYVKTILDNENLNNNISNRNKIQFMDEPLKDYMNRVEREYIEDCINQHNGSITKAAEKLGIHRTVVYRKLGKNEE